MEKKYQVCVKCVMDTTDPEMTFDEKGVCKYCILYENFFEKQKNNLFSRENLEKKIQVIKKDGQGKKYDCIIGVSGGVDSSMVAYFVKQMGLRPLAVHLDNGWNSEFSMSNIERVLKKLDIDLYTHVIDWEEFKDLQLSFFKASVINLEIPTDHAIWALLCNKAVESGIKYIIHGANINSEFIMPSVWAYDARDLKHIKAIHKRFGSVKLKTFPMLSLWKSTYYTFSKKNQLIPILNYLDYDKEKSKEFLKKEFGWQDYGGKHSESVFTKFFQNYMLPVKFNIDKRKAHYSSLINSGQMTRESALEELEINIADEPKTKEDLEYVIRKLDLTKEGFEKLMNLPIKSYKDYPNDSFWFERMLFVYSFLKRLLVR